MEYKVFGCKTNRYFAEKWLAHPHMEGKKGFFIASCVVTDKAKAKWVKYALRKLPTLKDNEKLYLSGCGNIRDGVVDPRFFETYHELSDWQGQIQILPEDPDDVTLTPVEKRSIMQTKIRSLRQLTKNQIFTRKFMVIQTGCDNFCTFCLTVQARGRHKWRPMDEVVEEIIAYVEQGGREVVLTGINLGAWGSESSNNYQDSRIVDLVETILSKTQLERLRISSLGVEFCSDELISLFKNTRIVAYPHLSIQSGSSKILKSMGRHYDGQKTREVLEKFHNLERDDHRAMNIGADIIVGFPGETPEDFEETRELITKYHVTQLHAFPFSAHMDHYSVPAGMYPDQVPNHIIQSRLKSLLETGKSATLQFATEQIGKDMQILVEKISTGPMGEIRFSGWSENYLAGNEKNIEFLVEQKIVRGAIVRGIYTGYHESSEEN